MERAGISKGSSTRQICLQLLVVAELAHLCHGDIGTAGQYTAPYLPTACYKSDEGQFPPSELFGSAGEGIWENGEACGRLYSVQCISGPDSTTTCVPGQTVQVKIVDRALTSFSRPSRNDTAMVLSTTAFEAIANASAAVDACAFGIVSHHHHVPIDIPDIHSVG